ncbi:hypothetical protein K1T71_008524 [Dendrolimus kikuchii]|uniref:Uncharacterized protein n=1 Tax=Dendrolimus kikuchii TaxID=765133 RepID=A0ACC1CXQ9_9NEOP|nr:hypothetical protein K1T71_008524 [Dendrolimus kikuchii]
MSGAGTPTTTEPPPLDDRDVEPRTPMKRLGSTRKLAAFNNIRMQLCEQTRVLEARAEATAGVAGELHDYCRRRADLESEYARALEKLARAAHQRHEGQRHKREQWPLTGAYACWQAALDGARALARDHAALADLYGGPLATRLQRAGDDALRLHRKCREIVTERHEEVGAALAEAAAAGKAHAAAAHEWRAAALKLRHAHDQRARLAAASPPRHKKLKALDKELDKRRARHAEARARALRARADYVLSLEAANATLQRYYLDDIADIILCMEVGFDAVVGRAARTAGEAEERRGAAAGAAAGALRAAADALDALADRQRLLDAHAAAFALPRPLPYQGSPPDKQDAEMLEAAGGAAEERDEAAARVHDELAARLHQLEAGARRLRAECHENAKTLDAAEAELIKQMEGSDAQWDVSGLFGVGAGACAGGAAGALAPLAAEEAGDAPRRDQEDYYLAKFRSYVSCAGRLARIESKAAALRGRGGAAAAGAGAGVAAPPSPPRRAAARLRRGQFAAPLDHRLPLVLTSCVRVIATYGLRHQGIFRVSGSQVEMQALRAAFERGEDPLAQVRDASDINSVCGLLKLYLREVRPPLVPPQLQERLLRVAAVQPEGEFVARLRETLAALPQPAVLVLRYLFAFLAHLAEHSEHNMMDAWNLAICVGPTLLAAWGDGGAQLAAQNLVNELVKRTIQHHLDVFPQDIAPYALYTRFRQTDVESEFILYYICKEEFDLYRHGHNVKNTISGQCFFVSEPIAFAGVWTVDIIITSTTSRDAGPWRGGGRHRAQGRRVAGFHSCTGGLLRQRLIEEGARQCGGGGGARGGTGGGSGPSLHVALVRRSRTWHPVTALRGRSSNKKSKTDAEPVTGGADVGEGPVKGPNNNPKGPVKGGAGTSKTFYSRFLSAISSPPEESGSSKTVARTTTQQRPHVTAPPVQAPPKAPVHKGPEGKGQSPAASRVTRSRSAASSRLPSADEAGGSTNPPHTKGDKAREVARNEALRRYLALDEPRAGRPVTSWARSPAGLRSPPGESRGQPDGAGRSRGRGGDSKPPRGAARSNARGGNATGERQRASRPRGSHRPPPAPMPREGARGSRATLSGPGNFHPAHTQERAPLFMRRPTARRGRGVRLTLYTVTPASMRRKAPMGF